MAPTESELNAGIVSGVGALNHDEVRPRLDIDVMIARQPDVFNLFLLALIDLKADISKLGYFSLAGIHGLPTSLWDGVGKDFPDNTGGYCAHGRLIFPTWHRPYLALFEQTLYRKMRLIIKKFDVSLQSKYLAAAKAFRLPYWDYFRPRDIDARFPGIKLEGQRTRFDYDFRMPDIMNVKDVMIREPPNDYLGRHSNPLYSFKFTDKQNLDRDWIKAELQDYNPNRTVRCPRNKQSKDHNVRELNEGLNSGREGRTSTMLDILNPYSRRNTDFQEVASDTVLQDMTQTIPSQRTSDILRRGGDRKAASYGSIEALHGDFHTIIGGNNGHMKHPSIAAFDPIFWLHHCNVDRIFAIWQALHPDTWFASPRDRRLKPENEKDLLPFYKFISELQPVYYDSDWARDTESFGYTYPDLDGLRSIRTIWEGVYNRYAWSFRSATSRKFSKPPTDMMPLNLNKAQVFRYSGTSSRSATVDQEGPRSPTSPTSPTARITYKRITSSDSHTMVTKYSIAEDYGFPRTSATTIEPYFDREWYIDNIVKRNALNGPFTIYFFLCSKSSFPDDPDDYMLNPYLAGVNHIFAAPREVCDNCGQQDAAGYLASDTMSLTPLLLDYVSNGTLESMRPSHVRPFLVKYLRWRIAYAGNETRDPRNIPNFEVSVSAKRTHDDGSETYESYGDIVEDIIYNAT